MEKTTLADKAIEYKVFKGYNCCQSVALSLIDDSVLSKEQILSIASGFAAGMGSMEADCGALIGAVIAAGVKTEGKAAVMRARMIADSFKKKCGALTCAELKGKTTGKPLCSCEDCVKNAVISYLEAFK